MITVYGAPPTRAVRVIWMLEEMGLDYRVRPVDFAGRLQDAEFLEHSPSGAMPGFADGEVKMMESIAILEYLGARHGPTPLVVTPDEPAFARYQQFLHYGESSLAAPLNIVIASRFFAPEAERQNWGAQMAVRMTAARWDAVAAQLKTAPFLVGERFTAADISCAYGLHLARATGFYDGLDPVLHAYWERLSARDAYQRAMRHTGSAPGPRPR